MSRVTEKRKRDAIEMFEHHLITERSVINDRRATFVIRPGPGSRYKYGGHVAMEAGFFGNLIVYGDWEPVVFGRGSWHHWRGAFHWIARSSDASDFYVGEKARIGSGHDFTEWVPEEAKTDLLWRRRELDLKKDVARDLWDMIQRGDSQREVQEAICAKVSDGWELAGTFGMVPSWPLWMAWAALCRLDALLEAEEREAKKAQVAT